MAVVWIPSQMRDLTAGKETVAVAGATVRQVIDGLERLFPGIKARLCDGDKMKSGIAVAVGTQIAARGLAQPLDDASEVHFLPAIGGGLALGKLE